MNCLRLRLYVIGTIILPLDNVGERMEIVSDSGSGIHNVSSVVINICIVHQFVTSDLINVTGVYRKIIPL